MIKNYFTTFIVMMLGTIINLQAQTPYLVKDLNESRAITGGSPVRLGLNSAFDNQIKALNGILIYNSRDVVRGTELWRTDGTPEGTFLLKDINRNGSSVPSQFVKFGNVLLFAANEGELWKTDGTTNGTVLIKTGFENGLRLRDFDQERFFNGTFYFFVTEGEIEKQGLWKTDGTEEGTVLVKNLGRIASLSNRRNLRINNTLFFTIDDEASGIELWKSDGTTEGTTLVKDINAGITRSSVDWMTNYNNTLFFTANDGILGNELWQSDGTEAGTVLVKDITEGSGSSAPINLITYNNKLYFSHGGDLWQSDGTAVGTFNFADGGNLERPADERFFFTEYENALYFTSNHGTELWKTDGTTEGTLFVNNFGERKTATGLVPFQNKLSIRIGSTLSGNRTNELWQSDGTAEGLIFIKDINPKLHFLPDLIKYSSLEKTNDKLYFISRSAEADRDTRLWVTDGTSQGTNALASGVRNYENATNPSNLSSFIDANGITLFISGNKLCKTNGENENTIELRTFSHISNLVNYNNAIYFRAVDPIQGLGLWKSNGTVASTVLVKTIDPQASEADLTNAGLVLNGVLYFTANDGVHGEELWKSDGTETSTIMVKDINTGAGISSEISEIRDLNGTICFTADDGIHGIELWKSDGTEAGTVLVKDIYPGANIFGAGFPKVVVDNLLYFIGNDGVHGRQLWKSDGTETGTIMIKDLSAGGTSGSITGITEVDEGVVFIVDRDQLWKTNGTEAGTLLLKKLDDINERFPKFSSTQIISNGPYLYVLSTNSDGVNGTSKLWKSDGTEAGTAIIKTFSSGQSVTFLKFIEGVLYFSGDDGMHGDELWKTDGTEIGTVMVKDINLGEENSNPSFLTEIEGTIYFSADDGLHGEELWQTDGTEAGTELVSDIAEGTLSSYPHVFSKVNGITYLSAEPRSKSNFNYGRELMALGNCAAENKKFNNLYPLENVVFTSEEKQGSTTETCHCNIFNELLNSTDATGVNPISNIFTNTIYMDESANPDYVSRHYEIAPETNISGTTGGITLYFTQEEFDVFNALQRGNSPSGKGNASNTQLQLLPTSPNDIANISNIRILNRSGNSSDGSGSVATYPEDVAVIDPVDTNIVWNANDDFWEVQFNTDAFGGFWLTSALRAETLNLNAIAEKNTITLSPNPVQAHIDFKGLQSPKTYTIYNVHGVVVQKGTATNALKANVSTLSSGMYIVKFDDESLSIKILKK